MSSVRDTILNMLSKLFGNTRRLGLIRPTVKGNIIILYVGLREMSEKIRRAAERYVVRTAFHSRNTIGKFTCDNTFLDC